MLHVDFAGIDRNIRCKNVIERRLGVPEMSFAKAQTSVNLASFDIDLAVGMKGAVFVIVPSEEEVAGDVDVGSENLSRVATVEIEARNLSRLEPNLLRDRTANHHDCERHAHVGEIE